MSSTTVKRLTCARIPTADGEFQLCLYRSNHDDKEHLALVIGDIGRERDVLVRVHSECFTGDVLGSQRCDCGWQLKRSLELIAASGCGVIVYLRQEGRGIGLLDKLRAYNLQDVGYDTVDANLMLGHQADARDYRVAGLILQDLGVRSMRLLTNNPAKIESLEKMGLIVSSRVPLQTPLTTENLAYLAAKVQRMRHLLDLNAMAGPGQNGGSDPAPLTHFAADGGRRPLVTLHYAQNLDGSLATKSEGQAQELLDGLRAANDAILVGVGTVLADNPSLRTTSTEAPQPAAVVVDSRLRVPPDAALLQQPGRVVRIATTQVASPARRAALIAAGAQVWSLAADDKQVSLPELLGRLLALGVNHLLVEGGNRILSSFLAAHLVDRVVLTIAPHLVGSNGSARLWPQANAHGTPQLRHSHFRPVGDDLVLIGDIVWSDPETLSR